GAQYGVSVAAEGEGGVGAGVVHNPATGDRWTATRGAGAWRDGRRLRGSTATKLGHCLVATGFGYDPARRGHQAEGLARLMSSVRDIPPFGAAPLDLCFPAQGLVDAYYERGLNAWDHAAGGLVAAEAGLLVTGLCGAPPSDRMVVAAMPAIHGALHDRLVDLAADDGP